MMLISRMIFMAPASNEEVLSGRERLPALYQLSPESNWFAPQGAPCQSLNSLLECATTIVLKIPNDFYCKVLNWRQRVSWNAQAGFSGSHLNLLSFTLTNTWYEDIRIEPGHKVNFVEMGEFLKLWQSLLSRQSGDVKMHLNIKCYWADTLPAEEAIPGSPGRCKEKPLIQSLLH